MDLNWQLADAKSKLSEVVNRALSEGPQRITRRDDAVMILSEAEYLRLTGKRTSLVQKLMDGPSMEDIDLTRDNASMRDVDL